MKQKLKKIYNASILLIGVALLIYLCVSENGLFDLARHIGSLQAGWLALAFVGMLGELLLDEGLIYSEILEKTGASSTTISRVNRCLHYGAGGYQTMVARLREQDA